MAVNIEAPHARATARYIHVSPYKVRQVLDQIRGLSVGDAERILELSPKDAAGDSLKVLISAIANAEHNFQLPAEELYVALAYADEGPTRKWGQARARGRYFRIRKRTSHITIVVARYDEDRLEERRRVEEMTGRGAATQQRQRAERVRRSRAAAEPEAVPEATDEEVEEIEELEEEIAAGEAEIEAVDEVEAEAEAEADGEEETE
jgi:large subunit ribosomal protein L22